MIINNKIIVITHDAHPHGAQLLCLNIVNNLVRYKNFDVVIISLGNGILLDEFSKFCQLYVFNDKDLINSDCKKLLNQLYAKGYKAAIANTTVSGRVIPLLASEGICTIALVHEMQNVLQFYELQNCASSIAYFAECVVFPSNTVKIDFECFLGHKIKNSFIRPQGLYQNNFLVENYSKDYLKQSLRDSLKLPHNSKIILGVGYADKRKGFDLFSQIALNVFESISNTYAIWVGHYDESLVYDTLSSIENEELRSRIFITGRIDNPQLFYAGADVFALTSREDPFPSVILESLHASLPLVAFKNSGGFEEFLNRGFGILAEPQDTIDFSNKIIKLLNNESLRMNLGVRGKAVIDKEFLFSEYVDFLISLLDFDNHN